MESTSFGDLCVSRIHPQRKTAQKKLKEAVRKVYEWCKVHRHDPVENHWQALCRKVQDHYGFYGITFNMRSVRRQEQYVGPDESVSLEEPKESPGKPGTEA